jgi:hypothetical protein
MRRGTRIGGNAALLMTLAGCGNPLTSASAYEVPLFTMTGDFYPGVQGLASPRVNVVWVDPVGLKDDRPQPTEDTHFALDGAGYAFDIFAPPQLRNVIAQPLLDTRDIPRPRQHRAGTDLAGMAIVQAARQDLFG